MHLLMYSIMGVLDVYLFQEMFSNEFEFRYESVWSRRLYYCLLAVINSVIPMFITSRGIPVVCIISYGIAMLLLYQGNILAKLLLLVLQLFFGSFAEMLGVFEYAWLTGKEIRAEVGMDTLEWTLIVLEVSLIKVAFVKLLVHLHGKKKHMLEGKAVLLLLAFPVISCYLAGELFYLFIDSKANMRIKIVICMVLILILNMLVFYLIEKMSMLLLGRKEYELFKQKNDLERKYYSHLEKIEKRQRVYQHDMKHYVEAFSALLAKENSQEAKKLFEQMKQQIEELDTVIYTSNGILNALLEAKVQQAEKQQVCLQMEIEPTVRLTFLQETDMIAMFGNLIDNAIRAAASCRENREVVIRLFEPEGNFVLFMVENHYEEPVKKKGNIYFSTKEEAGHGLGIASVRELAGKYGGILDLQDNRGVFVASLSLSKVFVKQNASHG